MLTLLISFSLSGQNGIVQVGARPAGIGYAYVATSDNWSIFYNPAGINKLEETSALFSFENKFNVEGLNTLGAAFTSNLNLGSIGISLFRFGDDIYSEQRISAVYSNSFGITSLGVRINYLQYHSEITETQHSLVLDFGGITSLNDQLDFGAFIRNINQAKVSGENDQSVPVVLNAGLSYRPNDQLLINAEIEKDIDFDAGLRVGFEYAFLKKFRGRAGVLTYPFTNFLGLGFNTSRLNIDYALTRNANLGFSNQASISYLLKKK